MALSNATVWEVRSTGNDQNGGGFVAGLGGVDRSQQDPAFATGTAMSVSGTVNTDVLPGGGYTPGAADVGNVIQVRAATGWTIGFYQIASIQGAYWRLDRSPAAAGTTGGVWSLGGALATLGQALGGFVTGNYVWLKSGTYNLAAGVTFPGGTFPSVAQTNKLLGYYLARGDITPYQNAAQRPVLKAAGPNLSLLSVPGYMSVENLTIDGVGLANTSGITITGGNGGIINCLVRNVVGTPVTLAGACLLLHSEVTGCTAAGGAVFSSNHGSRVVECWVHDNAGPGLALQNPSSGQAHIVTGNIISNNTGPSSDGIQTDHASFFLNNTIHGNGRYGIICTTNYTSIQIYHNNLFTMNGAAGLAFQLGPPPLAPNFRHDGNCYWANTGGNRVLGDGTGADDPRYASGPYANYYDKTLTADPYVNRGANDFRLNNVAGGGADARGAGVPRDWPGNAMANRIDFGTAQHADPAAAATVAFPVIGRVVA
jgi:hypothetical protein